MKPATVIALTRAAYRQGERHITDKMERQRRETCETLHAEIEVNRTLTAERDRLTQELDDARQSASLHSFLKMKEERDYLRAEVDRLQAIVVEVTSPSSSTGQALQRAQIAVERLEGDVERLRAENTDLRMAVMTAEARLADTERECERLTAEIDDVDGKLIAVGKERDGLTAELETARQERAYAEARRKDAEALAVGLREAEDADTWLGRLVRAMPGGYYLMHDRQPSGRWVCYTDWARAGTNHHRPEDALTAAGVAPTTDHDDAALRAEEGEAPA